ncbi:MAG: replication initiator protein A [Lachnospiraceae bacterium]|nr:replication initiator protein A [Lachnospiraceae bacterium]
MENKSIGSYNSLKLDYYHPDDKYHFMFTQIPEFLFEDPVCQKLSNNAKLLYGKMLRETRLAAKKGNIDTDGHLYIDFSLSQTCKFLNCSEATAKRIRKELRDCFGDGIGLVKFVSHGQGRPDYVYVMNYIPATGNGISSEVFNSNTKTIIDPAREVKNEPSGELKTNLSRELKSDPYNKINDKESLKRDNIYHLSFTTTTHPKDDDDEQRISFSTERFVRKTNQKPYSVVLDEVKTQIGFNQLLTSMPDKAELITSIAEIMAQEFISNSPGLSIKGCTYQRAEVNSRLRSIDMPIVKYILSCLSSSKSKVNYIQRYILATLLNAPAAYKAQKAYGRLAEQNISAEHSNNHNSAKPNTKHAYQPYIGRNYTDDEIRALELKKLGITG